MSKPLRIGVLGSPDGWYLKDLARAAEHQVLSSESEWSEVQLIPLRFDQLSVWSCGRSEVRTVSEPEFDPQSLLTFDAILVRTMPMGSLEQVVFRMNALHIASQLGIRVINSPRCLEICIDKWLTLDFAKQSGLLTPRTICCQTRQQALEAWDFLGQDCVVKPLFGGEGRGIVRVQDYDMAWRVFSTLEQLRTVLYVQEFLPSGGTDLRLLLLDDEMYCVRRDGGGNWRANVSQGGTATPYEPTFEQVDIAYRAAKAVQGWMVGVDILETLDGRNYLIEVNAVPGWKATGAALGVDVASRLLDKLSC